MTSVWIFNGDRNRFPSAVFDSFDTAVQWIRQKNLTGTLTEYPVNVSAYDWALQKDFFEPRKPHHHEAEFIANFSSASQRHEHFVDGKGPGED